MGYVRDHIKHQPSPSITLRGNWMGELIIRLAEG
ncbi:hypothetical protein [Rosenbergiella epipactidis]